MPLVSSTDFLFIVYWWIVLFFIGIFFLPLSRLIFKSFLDKGYIFSKILGMGIISYLVFILGVMHLVVFSQLEIIIVAIICLLINYIFTPRINHIPLGRQVKNIFGKWKIFFFEEVLFFVSLYAWSYVRSFQPDVHGLEKFMDFGFVNSILRSSYFPPTDVWFPPYPINYYYFGHLVTAVLTKLSEIPSNITFNLMLATLFGLTFVCSLSLASTLFSQTFKKAPFIKSILAGFISAFFLTLAGNLHTIYLFFKPYQNDNPVAPWQLVFSPFTFPNSYWYPNATRFIYHTIHEFPIYSFVVSDLHGHVLDIPFVLLTISALFAVFLNKQDALNSAKKLSLTTWKWDIILFGFLFALMYMTNAWDGIIYFILTIAVLFFPALKSLKKQSYTYIKLVLLGSVLFATTAIFLLPFETNFSPGLLVHGIGVLCAPQFLIDKGHFGPFIFEPNSCQRSPWWQLLILYGFFYFWVISFIVFLYKTKKILNSDFFVLVLITISTILIIIPEFFYMKDIYPTYQRANTMFKLVYQSFMMLSLSSGYILVRIIRYFREEGLKKRTVIPLFFWSFFALMIICCVSLYPYFAITSYYNISKNNYSGLDGTKYLQGSYPTDYVAINWINKNIQGQPVTLEAQGDSYTDFARVSANTGLPTVLGWTVHEWLWRGSYDVPAPRITDVQIMYESKNLQQTTQLLKKYNVKLVFVGALERQKYTNLYEQKFGQLGKIIYQNGSTRIYKLNI